MKDVYFFNPYEHVRSDWVAAGAKDVMHRDANVAQGSILLVHAADLRSAESALVPAKCNSDSCYAKLVGWLCNRVFSEIVFFSGNEVNAANCRKILSTVGWSGADDSLYVLPMFVGDAVPAFGGFINAVKSGLTSGARQYYDEARTELEVAFRLQLQTFLLSQPEAVADSKEVRSVQKVARAAFASMPLAPARYWKPVLSAEGKLNPLLSMFLKRENMTFLESDKKFSKVLAGAMADPVSNAALVAWIKRCVLVTGVQG